MNKRIFLITAALGIVTMSGCNKDGLSGFPEDRVIRVSTDVSPLTKGYHTTANLNEFYLIVDNVDTPSYSYYSRKVQKNSSGEWEPTRTMLWHNATDRVNLVAIAPFSEAVDYSHLNSMTFTVQEQQSADDKKDDLVAWSCTGFVPETDLVDGKVQIEFKHLLSKLNITFKLGNELNADGIPQTNPIVDVKVSGVYRNGAMSMSSAGELSVAENTSSSPASILPYNTAWRPAADVDASCTASYEGIVIPQHIAAGGLSVSFTMNGLPYVWNNPQELDFAGNTAYNITIKVGKDRIKAGSISAVAWDEQPETGLETE